MRKHYEEMPLFPNEELAEQELKRSAMASGKWCNGGSKHSTSRYVFAEVSTFTATASQASSVTDAGESPNEVKPNKEIIMAIFKAMKKPIDKAENFISGI